MRVVIWLAVVNAFLFLVVMAGGILVVSPWIDSLLNLWITGDAFYWDLLSYLVAAVAWVVAIFLLIFVFLIAANFIAGFFHEELSKRVEFLVTGHAISEATGFWVALRSVFRSLVHGIYGLLKIVLVYACLLPLNLIPVLGSLLYSFLSLTFTFYRIGIEFLDYPFEVNGLDPSRRKALVSGNKGLMIGFGGCVFLMLLIPVVNFAAVPIGVAGGTILYCEVFRDVSFPNREINSED